jgi:hypothetical protein
LKKKGGVVEKRGEEETKSMPHAPVHNTWQFVSTISDGMWLWSGNRRRYHVFANLPTNILVLIVYEIITTKHTQTNFFS